MSLTEKLAALFRNRPHEWVNGYELMRVGGSFAFRTRVSELRMPPYRMVIENRQERHKSDGRKWTETFYRYCPDKDSRQPPLPLEGTANDAHVR